MKKVKLFCLILLIAGLVKADETITVSGIGGRSITATTTASLITLTPACRTVWLYNSSPTSTVVWCAVNCSTSVFATIVSGTNAIPLRGGQSQELKGIPTIATIAIQAVSGTCVVDIAAKILED